MGFLMIYAKGSIAGQNTCPVESEQIVLETFFSTLNISNVSNVMGARINSTSSTFRRWIDNETYIKMITQLNKTLQNSSKQMIVISASANTTFSVSPKGFYVIQSLYESSQDDFLTGNLSVVTLDSSERILSRIYIDPRSAIFGEEGNLSESNSTELLIVLPFENVSSILFINNITNTTISQRTVSPNPPLTILSIDVPFPTLQRGRLLSIHWNSTDDDNDPLLFTALINDGNSSIYSPIFPEINQTNITYNSSTLQEAANYIIQLLSTDGVNTNVSYSGNFSLRNPPEATNVSKLSNISSTQVYAFLINATSIFNFSNVSWTLKAGSNVTINNIIPFNLTSGTNVQVFVEFNATNETVTEANVTVTSENLTGFAYLRFPRGVISVENFTQLASSGSVKIFEVIVRNTGDLDIPGVNWAFNTGDNQGTQTIYSTFQFNLSSNQSIRMYVEYNYSNTSGTHEATIILNSTQSNAQSAINVSFASSGITITSFGALGQSRFNTTFELLVQNTGAQKDSNSWSVNTGDAVIQSVIGYNLSSNQTIYVFIEHNYSRFGQFSPAANVNTDEDTETTSVNISEFIISNLSSLVESGLNRTFEFFIVNIWGPTLAANWTLNTGIDSTSNIYSISSNNSKNVTVYFQYDYPSLQNRTITAMVYTNQSNHTQSINI